MRTHTCVHVSLFPRVVLNVLRPLREEEKESPSVLPQPPPEVSLGQVEKGCGGQGTLLLGRLAPAGARMPGMPRPEGWALLPAALNDL